MRRFMVGCALGFLASLASGAPAPAQFYQQRLPARVVDPPSVTHISAARGASAEGAFAPTNGKTYPSPPGAAKPRIMRVPQADPAAPAPAAPVAPPASQTDSSAGDSSGSERRGWGNHHHHHHQGGGWPVWGGYPLFWAPGYTSGFAVYDPYYLPFPQQGFGIFPQQQVLPQALAPADPPALELAPAAKPKVRATSAAWKAKAGRYIGYGDTNFGKQSYLAAVERYRTAAQMAPDVAEPFLRQGFALVALGQYENAAKAFRRGLRVRSDWFNSPFRLDQIYGNDKIAKTSHLENLAKAVEANPLDAELLLVLGMEIFFDGQPDRAEVFFSRAAQLGGNGDKLLDDFLPRPGPAGAPDADAAPKAGQKVVF